LEEAWQYSAVIRSKLLVRDLQSSFVTLLLSVVVAGCNHTKLINAGDAAENAGEAAKSNTVGNQTTGHYFGYGLKLAGVENCAEIEKSEGPIDFKGCVGRNVERAEQLLQSTHDRLTTAGQTEQLKQWKDQAFNDCENWANDEWGGGSGYGLAVEDCYGRKIWRELKTSTKSGQKK
jgi:hypothetical protein